MGSDSTSNGSMSAETKEMMQSLREIVNKKWSDTEIYAVLKECGMDPNDAAQRLLSQDTFHVVKSKRDRRKKVKETQELRARGNSSGSNRGRVSGEYFVRSSPMQSSSEEVVQAVYKRVDVPVAPLTTYSSSISHASRKTPNEQHSNYRDADAGRQSLGAGDTVYATGQESSALQPNQVATTSEHVSMAKSVRMEPPEREIQQDNLTSADRHIADRWPVMEQVTAAVSDAKLHSPDDSRHEMQEGHSSLQTTKSTISSAASRVQQSNIVKNEPAVSPDEDNCTVVLPDYLQALAGDCSHLSFGTFRSGGASALSANGSSTANRDAGKVFAGTHDSSAVLLGSKNLEYHGEEDLRSMYGLHRRAAEARNHDLPAGGRSELYSNNIYETIYGTEPRSQSLIPNSHFNNTRQLNSPSPMPNDPNNRYLPVQRNELDSFPNSIPIELLESNAGSSRTKDSASLPGMQSIPLRYGNALLSMSEGLSSGAFPLSKQPSQALPDPNSALGLGLPQHLSTHSFSGYPEMNQNRLMSSAQHNYPDNNVNLDSVASMNYNSISQYRSSRTLNSLPHPNSNTSNFGNFGSSASIPGSILHNMPDAPPGVQVDYDDVMNSQYRRGNSYPLQQNDSSAAWNYGPGSRMMSTIPEENYQNLLGRNQQHGGDRESMQRRQLYEALGYSDVYNSGSGLAQEQKQKLQQNLGNLSLNDFRGPPTKPSNQFWHPGY